MIRPEDRHGHVLPHPQGLKARCGGPALCGHCREELGETGIRWGESGDMLFEARDAGWGSACLDAYRQGVTAADPVVERLADALDWLATTMDYLPQQRIRALVDEARAWRRKRMENS